MTALLLLFAFGQGPRPRRVRRARGWQLAGWVARTVLYAMVIDRAVDRTARGIAGGGHAP